MSGLKLLPALVFASAILLYGCGGGSVPSPHECQTSSECAEIRTTTDQACRLPFGWSNEKFYTVFNSSTKKAVYVSYEEAVRHLDSLRPDESTTKMVSVKPQNSMNLGCFRTKGLSNDHIDEWSYTIKSSCFADECPSVPKEPAKEREPRKTCEQLCSADDPICLKYVVEPTDQDVQFARELEGYNQALMNASPPDRINISGLVNLSNAITGSTSCSRGTLDISGPSNGLRAINTGSSCPIGLSIQHPAASEINIMQPGNLKAAFEFKKGQSYSIVPDSTEYSPMLRVRETSPDQWVEEPIVKLQGVSGHRMTFTGRKYYCAQIDWTNTMSLRSQGNRRVKTP